MTYGELIKFYGSQASVARALSISQPSVFDWKKNTIPYARQCEIQLLTQGKLTARKQDDLREISKMRRRAKRAA